MIKHVTNSLQKHDKIKEDQSYNQFQTFQICQNEMNSLTSNRDSLLFSQSRKADDPNKSIGHILSSISKQELKQYQQQKQRGSSIKKNKNYETIKENSQCQHIDPLAQYMIAPFQYRNSSLSKHQRIQSKQEIGIINQCQRCRYLDQEHKKELSFLTKNNQELYELNKKLSEQLNNFVKNYETLQKELSNQKKENNLLLKEIELLKQKMEGMQYKYFERQKKYLKEKQFNLKTHENQLKIVEKINQCLQQKQKISRQKTQKRSLTKTQMQRYKRSKTQYDCDLQNKKTSTVATWQGSCTKYTPRKVEISRQMFSEQKLRNQIDNKVGKLSQQKKKILSKVAKQNLTVQDLQPKIPQAALSKMGKGNVGKLTLAKASLGRSSSFFGGSISLAPTQKKCR